MKKILKTSVLAIAMPYLSWAQGFTTNNTNGNLLDACGNNFIMKGINVPLSWYVSNVNGSIAALKTNTKSNCLRIVVNENSTDASWQTTVTNCINNKIIPMVELHDVTGSTDPAALKRMGDFWAARASYFNQPNIKKHILINLANEWGTWQTATNKNTVWRDAVINAIKPMRDAGITTTIVIDAVGYGQDIDDAYNIRTYAKDIQRADNNNLGGSANSTEKANLLFSIHMYCEWRKGGDNIGIINTIKSKGIPIIVGEFGYQHATDGSCDIDEQAIMNTCQSGGIGWLAWSQKGNGGGVEYLDLCTDWNCTQLSSWGNTVINGTNGTKTAVECSVFSNPTCNTTCPPTTLTPSVQVNGGAWQSISTVAVDAGASVKLGPQPTSGGSWTWTGCGTSGTSREQTITPTSACTATATYTNSCGTKSTQSFTISINGAKTCCGSNATNGFAYCCTNSDPDGDGWGWENNVSCVVPNSAADPDKCKPLVTDVEMTKETSGFKIYPNPFSDLLHVECAQACQYKLFRLDGVPIVSGIFNTHITLGNEIPVGVYLLRLERSGETISMMVAKR
jgi:mannan endo-1,4-beta-mannosidase